jgi:hypothetical protein
MQAELVTLVRFFVDVFQIYRSARGLNRPIYSCISFYYVQFYRRTDE